MTEMRSVLMWALLVAVVGLATWWLVATEVAAGTWLIAAFLAAHGLVHLLFVAPAPAEATSTWAFDTSRSSVAERLGTDAAALRIVGTAAVLATAGGFVLAALATLGWLVPTGWWEPMTLSATVLSMVVLGLYANRQLVVGLGIDVVLLSVVLFSAWAP